MTAFDPFAGIVDDPAPAAAEQRDALLADASRGYVPLRKVLVQKPRTHKVRAAALADLVSGRQHRALDALLLLHALQPILADSPLPLGVWATILSTRTRCSRNSASRAFEELVELNLATRLRNGGVPTIKPLLEDQSGRAWSRPGSEKDDRLGFFVLPHAYWTDGFCDVLRMPGKAMLLVLLAETQNPKTPAFHMPVSRAHDWYGVSERTAERGYTELNRAGVLLVKRVRKADPRHPAGRRDVYWRALGSPFGTDDRAALQRAASMTSNERAHEAAPKPGAEGSVLS